MIKRTVSHQNHRNGLLAHLDQDLFGLLEVSDPSICDEKDDSVLHIIAGPHGIIRSILKNLAVAGGFCQGYCEQRNRILTS